MNPLKDFTNAIYYSDYGTAWITIYKSNSAMKWTIGAGLIEKSSTHKHKYTENLSSYGFKTKREAELFLMNTFQHSIESRLKFLKEKN